jgi:hypothetical protein
MADALSDKTIDIVKATIPPGSRITAGSDSVVR